MPEPKIFPDLPKMFGQTPSFPTANLDPLLSANFNSLIAKQQQKQQLEKVLQRILGGGDRSSSSVSASGQPLAFLEDAMPLISGSRPYLRTERLLIPTDPGGASTVFTDAIEQFRKAGSKISVPQNALLNPFTRNMIDQYRDVFQIVPGQSTEYTSQQFSNIFGGGGGFGGGRGRKGSGEGDDEGGKFDFGKQSLDEESRQSLLNEMAFPGSGFRERVAADLARGGFLITPKGVFAGGNPLISTAGRGFRDIGTPTITRRGVRKGR